MPAKETQAAPVHASLERVKAAVRKILDELAITRPPVSPREIAETYGLGVEEVYFKDSHKQVAGFIDFAASKIYVNADDPYNRKTFTIAHELGHFILHRDYFKAHPEAYAVLLRRPMSAAGNALEKEANLFAGHLLVPRQFLDRFYKIATVQELADLFAVSSDVIRIRLQQEHLAD
jgi:Zn-dependent peptidase ImmA (M78 family)